MRRRPATIEDLKNNYHNVLYKANDGLYYRLEAKYPWSFEVANRPDFVLLDTGGEMRDCYFAQFTVKEGALFEENVGTKQLRQWSDSIIVEEET